MGKKTDADMNARGAAYSAKKQMELEKKRKEKRNSIIITVCVILAAVLILGLVVLNKMNNSGVMLRSTTAAESENNKVTGTMMAYFYNTNLQSYAQYLSMLGVDTSKSLKAQECAYVEGGGTWFDYFTTLTKSYVKELLAVCEAAKKANVSLDDDDRATIQNNIKAIEEQAAANNHTIVTYLAATVGNGINVKDIEDCIGLMLLADKYKKEYTDSLSYTNEELEAFYSENQADYDGYDYYIYTLKASDFMEKDAEGNAIGDTAEANEKAKAAADVLAGAGDAAEFEALVSEYVRANIADSDASVDSALKAMSIKHALKSSLSEDVAGWAESATACNTFTVTNEDSYTITVYMLVKEAYRYDMMARNVRHILFSTDTYEDSTKVNEVYLDWESDGFTEDKFVKLSTQYNEDTGSQATGGLYENLSYGETVEEFNDWAFDEARVPGDHGMIETSYGWHIMYYVGEGDMQSWAVTAEANKKNEDYAALVEENSTSVKFIDSAIGKIDA